MRRRVIIGWIVVVVVSFTFGCILGWIASKPGEINAKREITAYELLERTRKSAK